MPLDAVIGIVTAVGQRLGLRPQARPATPRRQACQHHVESCDDESEQRILLADFGIARDMDDISGLTSTNMTIGTVAYWPPNN